jgi:hypothetical protein
LTLEPSLIALVNPFALDGRPVSTHPPSASGFAPINCYLLVDGAEALMIDTGVAVHEARIIAQLADVLSPGTELSIFVLRLSEYNSVSNARAIAREFNVTRLITGGGIPTADFDDWLCFQPDDHEEGGGALGRARLARAARWSPMGQTEVRGPGDRRLQLLRPELQLISTYWLYDAASRTLFTSDAFSHVWRKTDSGPWTVEEPDDAPSVEELSEYLVGSRYWWLAGANTLSIRRALERLREAHEIERVAPATGCILAGRHAVERHFELMDQALERLGAAPKGSAHDLHRLVL